MSKWGLCSTILAPTDEILRFVAYHLELGAHRVYIYLDDENDSALTALKQHPKVRARKCDQAYWNRSKNGKRPPKHQSRQTANATHAYHLAKGIDWLVHMDVDEFLVPARPIDQVLANAPEDKKFMCARPMEHLAGSGSAFKSYIPNWPKRRALVESLYPQFGSYLRGGFVSHVLGKSFVRTNLEGVHIQIHRAYQNREIMEDGGELATVDLAHFHAKSWEYWKKAYVYRIEHGSYRAELKPAIPHEQGGLTLHELLRFVHSESGEDGLRAFFDEVIGDSAEMRAKLSAHDLLREVHLDFDTPLAKHFPEWAPV